MNFNMSRRKLKKFADVAQRHNVIEPGKPLYDRVKGNWNARVFNNANPIVAELACGRGEYTVGLARKFADINYIGIDMKGDRLWKGSGIALEEGLDNATFLRTNLLELAAFFEPGEVSGIWITFPDPRPRDRDEKRRVTHSRFLTIYKQIIRPGGIIRLKTDNTGLFEYTLEVLRAREDITDLHYTFDLYRSAYEAECQGIRTRYENKFGEAGHPIKYLRFAFL